MANVQIATMYTVAFMLAIGALVTGFSFAILGGKYLESAARQPEMLPQLQIQLFILAGLIDAVTMVGVAIGLYFAFVNPFMGALVPYLPNMS